MTTTEYDTGLRVRKAAAADHSTVVETLTAAFFDDPFVVWWIPDPERRRHLLPTFFDITVDFFQPDDEIYTTDPEPAAAAVWVPPGRQPTGEDVERLVTRYVAAAEESVGRLLAALELMDQNHPHDAHAYLFLLSARPAWQSRGLGSALLREVLDRCDREGTPAYLEATCEANQRLYRRHGFELTGEIPMPDGPSLWPMWRHPR